MRSRPWGEWLTGYAFVAPAAAVIGVFGLFPIAPGYAFVRGLVAAEMGAILEGADVVTSLRRVNDEANRVLLDQLADLD